MKTQSGVWAWLSESRNQRTLTFIGSAVAAAVVAGWQLYLHFFATEPVAPQPVVVMQPSSIDPSQAERVLCAQAAATDAIVDKLDGIAHAIGSGDDSKLSRPSKVPTKPCPPANPATTASPQR
jgi:hypothetical protein